MTRASSNPWASSSPRPLQPRAPSHRIAQAAFASTAFVATMPAPGCAKPVRQPKSVMVPMAPVATSAMVSTRTTNARARAPALADAQKHPFFLALAAHARQTPIARQAFAPTDIVVIPHVTGPAKLVVRPKKEVVRTAPVEISRPRRILIMNALPAIAMARAPAALLRAPIPMELHVRPEIPVRPGFASMGYVAIRHAPRPAKLARPRKKAADPMACAATSREEPIPTMNAPLPIAMASALVVPSFGMAMVRLVPRPPSVIADIARTASVAIRAAWAHVCNAMRPELRVRVRPFPMVNPTPIVRRLAMAFATALAGVSTTPAVIVPRAANVPATSATI